MSPTVEETLATLTEMGFSDARAKKALSQTGWTGVEAAMEWLLTHPDDDGTAEEDEAVAAAPVAVKVLTEEERKEQSKRMEELRLKRRQEREENEAKDAIDREKRRVNEGKAVAGLKQQLAEEEMKKIAAERRREKRETELAREKVKAQIAADRVDKKEREARERGKETFPAVPPPAAANTAVPAKSYDETRIQIRQTDGKALVQTFKVTEPLSAVRLYVQLHRKDLPEAPANLMMTFPRKTFTEEDYDMPLDSLGLVPSAVLVIVK